MLRMECLDWSVLVLIAIIFVQNPTKLAAKEKEIEGLRSNNNDGARDTEQYHSNPTRKTGVENYEPTKADSVRMEHLQIDSQRFELINASNNTSAANSPRIGEQPDIIDERESAMMSFEKHSEVRTIS